MMPGSGSSRSGFMTARVVHLHASRFCNLTCKHCYSASGPRMRDELTPEKIISALPLFREEGYEVLSLSGGEPLLYSGFEAVVRSASELGFQVNLITNGAPVGGRLLSLMAAYINFVAVSLDGPPPLHNELRGNPNAFLWAERAMDRLKDVGMRFGIAYGVSRESLADIPWVVKFAEEKGAALVQLHPFASAGRGQEVADRLRLHETDKARAYFIAALLDMGKEPAIHLDLVPVGIAQVRRNDYVALLQEDVSSLPLSTLVNPLIIDETGLISPFSYGINPRLALGRLGSNMSDLIRAHKEAGWRNVRTLLEASFAALGTRGERFVDWFYHVVEKSYTLEESRWDRHILASH
jgi:Fe-coproporphyrin III synthase